MGTGRDEVGILAQSQYHQEGVWDWKTYLDVNHDVERFWKCDCHDLGLGECQHGEAEDVGELHFGFCERDGSSLKDGVEIGLW